MASPRSTAIVGPAAGRLGELAHRAVPLLGVVLRDGQHADPPTITPITPHAKNCTQCAPSSHLAAPGEADGVEHGGDVEPPREGAEGGSSRSSVRTTITPNMRREQAERAR